MNKKLIRIILSAATLLAAWLTVRQNALPMWGQLLVYLVPYLIAGYDVLLEAWEGICKADPFNEDFLMALATVGALLIGFLPGAESQMPEAVFVMLFFQVGELFEDYAEDKSRDSISCLMDIRPDRATVERKGSLSDVSPQEVRVGETIVVRPGEKIPLDGIITDGATSLNTLALTGESMPRDVRQGEAVNSGCINLSGVIRVKVTKNFNESTASRIISLVENASQNKSRSENFVRRFARIYTPIVVMAALVLAFVLYLYGIILVGSFVKTWGITNTPTMANYQYACKFGRKAITDTLKIAFVSTILGSMLGVVIGFILQRKQFIGHRLLEIGSMLNYALPGTVVGIAYIIAFNKKPFLLTGTMTILVAAYVFRYYATSIRSVMASLEQIDPTLEEASASLGASTAGTFLHVTVPLVIPAVLTGLRYLFIHSMTAISATIFLVSVRWTLLTSRILESMTELQFTQACAFSIILIIIVFIADGLMTWALHMYSVHFLKTKEATK